MPLHQVGQVIDDLAHLRLEACSVQRLGVAVARADSVERARVKANKVIAAIKVEL